MKSVIIDEVKLAKITLEEHENICICSGTLYISLFSVLLTINIGIGTFFVYYKYNNHDKETAAEEGSIFQTTIYWKCKNNCKKHKHYKSTILLF